MSTREDAIRRMNELGARREPFLFVIDFEMEHAIVLPAVEAGRRGILYALNGRSNYSGPSPQHKKFSFKKQPPPFADYRRAFDTVVGHLRRGDAYLVNLTFPTRIELDLTLREIFLASTAKYRLLVSEHFVVFSPEVFVQIRDGMISSFPMKGTIDAGVAEAEEKILSDPKELAEHSTVVDLIRNDLSMVAKEVRVERFRYVERLRTNMKDLLQVSSKITGRLPRDFPARIGELLFALLPAGSVSGAPKRRTVEIIQAAESGPRGYYTGVAGYFDGEQLDSGVMIRFIEQTADGFVYRSGGGITVFSDAEREYQELIDKVYVPIV